MSTAERDESRVTMSGFTFGTLTDAQFQALAFVVAKRSLMSGSNFVLGLGRRNLARRTLDSLVRMGFIVTSGWGEFATPGAVLS